MIVMFKVDVPSIHTTKDAHNFCQKLAYEMVQSSANLENDIKTIQYSVPKGKGKS